MHLSLSLSLIPLMKASINKCGCGWLVRVDVAVYTVFFVSSVIVNLFENSCKKLSSIGPEITKRRRREIRMSNRGSMKPLMRSLGQSSMKKARQLVRRVRLGSSTTLN